jgi:hypothetical protein
MPAPARFRHWLLGSVLVLNGLVMGAMALSLQRSYREAEATAETSAQNLTLVLREQIASAFDKVDFTLLSLAEEARRDMPKGGVTPTLTEAALSAKLRQVDVMGAIGVADANGQVLARTGTDRVQLNIAEREHFQRLRTHPQAGLVITAPVLSRVSQEWVIPLARPILRADGRFAGVVYAHVTLRQLRQLFSSLDVGPHGTITLRDNEMRLILRHPASEAYETGRREVSSELQARILSGELTGRIKQTQPVDGVERLAYFSRIRSTPYYLIVGRAPQDYLAPWRADAAAMAVFAALFLAVSLGGAALLLRQRERQQASLDALQSSEDKLKAILENAGASVFM